MRVLLTAKHPPAGGVAFGGVASWAVTIAQQLESRGHECAFWGPRFSEPWGDFDVGIIANYKATRRAASWCAKVVNVSHGVVVEETPGQDVRVVSTSEEVRDHWSCGGEILRQPIDLDFWRAADAERRDLVLYSYRARDAFGLDKLAAKLGLQFRHVKGVNAGEAREALQRAAMVCASGRAALEAMACEAPTLICDDRPYNGGPLMSLNLQAAMQTNYSGRGGVDPRKVDLEAIAAKVMATQRPRDYVQQHHDAARIADELLALC